MKRRTLLYVCLIITVFLAGCDLNSIGKAMNKGNKNLFFPLVANEEEAEKTQEKTTEFVALITSDTSMTEEEKTAAITQLVENIASMNSETQKQVREVLNNTTVTNYSMKDNGSEDAPTAYGFVSKYVSDTDTPETISETMSEKADSVINDLSEDVRAILNTEKIESLADCLGEIWAGKNGLLSEYYNQETPSQASVLVNEIITQSINEVLTAVDSEEVSLITKAAVNVMNSMTALEAITGNSEIGNLVNLIGQFVNLSGVVD